VSEHGPACPCHECLDVYAPNKPAPSPGPSVKVLEFPEIDFFLPFFLPRFFSEEKITPLYGMEWVDSLLRACHTLNADKPDHQKWINEARAKLDVPAPPPAEVEKAMGTLQDAAREGYPYVYEFASDQELWWADVLAALAVVRDALSKPPMKVTREQLESAINTYHITGPHSPFILEEDIQRFLHRLGIVVDGEEKS